MSNLISATDLHRLLIDSSHQELCILDASWYLPSQAKSAKELYLLQHIPGAEFFDIDAVCDLKSDYPHMLPSAQNFAQSVSHLGIDNESQVVVYDQQGLFSAARVWWMFRVFGHHNIKVLNGGLPAWMASAYHTSNEPSSIAIKNYKAKLEGQRVTNYAQMREICDSKKAIILDARPRARFTGEAPEPRAGLASGHMPKSISLPYTELLNDGHLKPKAALQEIFTKLGITQTTPVVTSCGSGVTAAIITLALDECGFGLNRLYDGAWSEWAAQADALILKGDEL